MTHIVLAGGGSAGHTSPMIATAECLREMPGVTVSCIGTADKLEATVVPAAGLEIDFIKRVVMPRSASKDLVTLPVRLAGAIRETRSIMKRRGARALVGFGGFASAPGYFAAAASRMPFFVQEQNASAGIANKVGARLGGKVAATYPDCGLGDARVLGLPMRRAIVEADREGRRAASRLALGLASDRPTILVSGGSLGARSINNALLAGVDRLLAANIDVIHVWGKTNFPENSRPSRHATTGASYLPVPFLEDMTQGYCASDLMIGRAGSNTVWELAALGLPGILVPLPHGNGEQELNAKFLEEAGGCEVVPDAQVDSLVALAVSLAGDDSRLAAMSAAAKETVATDGARQLAEWIVEVVH